MFPDIFTAVADVLKPVISNLFPDKQKAAEVQAQLEIELMKQKNEFDIKNKELENEQERVRLSAINNEAQSQDKWTSRARPAFMYVMYIMLLMSIPIGILTVSNPEAAKQIALGFKDWLNSIPQSLYELFGVGYLGYVGGRSFDKWHGAKKNNKV
jgi:hypothetical protein